MLSQAFLDALFHVHHTECQRSDSDLYSVLAVLLFVRFAELGLDSYLDFVHALEPLAMLTFHRFACNLTQMRTWVVEPWRQLYDDQHIESVFLAPLVSQAESWRALEASLSATVERPPEGAKPPARFTVPQPFNLTQPHVAPLSGIVATPIGIKAAPVPATTYEPDARLADAVASAKQAARDATRAKHAAAKPYKFKRMHATDKKEAMLSAHAAEHERRIHAPPRRAAPVPDFAAVPIPVRLNAAAILREEALFNKQLEHEREQIEAYEAGAHDDAAHTRWLAASRAAAAAAEAQAAEARRLESQQAREAAREARAADEERKRALAAAVAADKENRRAQAARAAEAEAARAREAIAAAAASKDGVRTAHERLVAAKRSEAAACARQTAQLKAQAESDARAERAARAEEIRRIRALERVRKPRAKVVDPTDESHGMSAVEAAARLDAARREAAAQTEARRAAIVASKIQRGEEFAARVARLQRLRDKRHADAARRVELVHAAQAQRGAAAELQGEASLLALHERLEDKGAQHVLRTQALAHDEAEARARARFVRNDRESLAREHAAELERTQARVVRVEQETHAAQATRLAETRAFAEQARALAQTKAAIEARAADVEASRTLQHDSLAASRARAAETASLRASAAQARAQQQAQREKHAARNPYGVFISERSREQARARRARAAS